MVVLKLYGDLQRHGKEFKFDVRNAGECLRALFTQFQDLAYEMEDQEYHFLISDNEVSMETLEVDIVKDLHDGDVLHIIPAVGGASGKFTNMFIGVVLVAASWYVGGAAGWGYLGATGLQATIATSMFMMGAAMIMGGAVQFLTKTPEMANMKSVESSKSSSFSSLENMAASGTQVQVVYGLEVLVGSKVLSQGVSSHRYDPDRARETEVIVEDYERKYYPPVVARDPKGNLYPTFVNDEGVRNRNYNLVPVKG